MLFALHGYAEQIHGRVVSVLDGDTIILLDSQNAQYRIRLAGIDAPEKSQAFGEVSKQSLSTLVLAHDVTVEIGKTDKYGRQVGKITVSGEDANLEQVKRGLAWHYKAYAREQSKLDRLAYAAAEDAAKEAQVGLWRDAEQTPPWTFRHQRKGTKAARKYP